MPSCSASSGSVTKASIRFATDDRPGRPDRPARTANRPTSQQRRHGDGVQHPRCAAGFGARGAAQRLDSPSRDYFWTAGLPDVSSTGGAFFSRSSSIERFHSRPIAFMSSLVSSTGNSENRVNHALKNSGSVLVSSADRREHLVRMLQRVVGRGAHAPGEILCMHPAGVELARRSQPALRTPCGRRTSWSDPRAV